MHCEDEWMDTWKEFLLAKIWSQSWYCTCVVSSIFITMFHTLEELISSALTETSKKHKLSYMKINFKRAFQI